MHNRRPHFLREQRKFVPNVMKLSIVIDHLYRFTLFIKISNSDHSTMRVLLPTFRFVSCLMGLGERHKSFYRCSLFANLFFCPLRLSSASRWGNVSYQQSHRSMLKTRKRWGPECARDTKFRHVTCVTSDPAAHV